MREGMGESNTKKSSCGKEKGDGSRGHGHDRLLLKLRQTTLPSSLLITPMLQFEEYRYQRRVIGAELDDLL